MTIEWKHEPDSLVVFTVSGELGIAEMEAVQLEAQKIILQSPNWKVLVVLQSFTGWTTEPGWADSMLFQHTDDQVERMAAVGPIEWRDQVEIFLLKGMRSIEIEYFTDEEQARAWLGVS